MRTLLLRVIFREIEADEQGEIDVRNQKGQMEDAIDDGWSRDPMNSWLGGCPKTDASGAVCNRNDELLNSKTGGHYCVCKVHKAAWCVGVNLFSAWREIPRSELLAQHKYLTKNFTPIEMDWLSREKSEG
jgi:hypothetical protein